MAVVITKIGNRENRKASSHMERIMIFATTGATLPPTWTPYWWWQGCCNGDHKIGDIDNIKASHHAEGIMIFVITTAMDCSF